MTALLDQFIIEARELIAEGSDDLLALERAGEDAERIERIFRAFHTLKGGAAIAELPDMSRLLHVAEDVLAALRQKKLACDADLINVLLACLDQVGQWVDALAAAGTLPAQAAERGSRLAAELRRHLPAVREAAAGDTDAGTAWARRMIAEAPDLARQLRAEPGPVVGIAYDPRADCFFNGDDPIGLLRKVPRLLAVEVETRTPWPALADMDPFACNLTFRALARAPHADVVEVFRLVPDQVRIAEITAAPDAAAVAKDPPIAETTMRETARKILAAQRNVLLAARPEREFLGALGAVVRAIRCALPLVNRGADAATEAVLLDAAHAQAAAGRSATAVLLLLDRLLAVTGSNVPSPATSDVGTTGSGGGLAARTLRIEEAKVDRLLDVAGELIIAKNTLNVLAARITAELGQTAVARAVKQQAAVIDRLVGQTHQSAVQLRMVPLAQVFRRLPRVVRDVAHELGKPATLVLQGEDTEADKSVVDALFEPLLHLVRNALDHGIEPPHERQAAAKPASARIGLSASRQGEQIIIALGDDGRGIDVGAVRRKAREQSLMGDAEIDALTDDNVIQLVFADGFSTAATVSEISGRGVGLSAVRASVERFGGSVSIASRAGEGTTVRLALPPSMAFMRIMTVHAGGEVFGVPIEAIAETVRLPRDHIIQIKSGEAFVLRDQIVPTCRLDRLLDIPSAGTRRNGKEVLILVTDASGQPAGIEVDAIGERLDVVVKPMQGLLADAPDYAGTTLLGNGRVLLVLNLGAVLQ
jgi:two-component system chemotaxis sensor kinase CheA